MPQVRFEPTVPGFERAKTVHALDRTATVIGIIEAYYTEIVGSVSSEARNDRLYP
jgi:hypothetical protein